MKQNNSVILDESAQTAQTQQNKKLKNVEQTHRKKHIIFAADKIGSFYLNCSLL